MRLSKTSWLILTIGILSITFGSLGVTRSQRASEARKLSEELAVAQKRLGGLELKELYTQQEGLQTKIGQAEAQLVIDQAMLAQPNDSIFVNDAVFHIAGISGVEVTQTSSTDRTRGDLEKMDATILAFEVVARGDLTSLIDFINRLNFDFPTGQLKQGEIVVSLASANATGNVSASSGPTARIQLAIYSYNRDK